MTKTTTAAGAVPYAEIIIRAGDTRPIIITSELPQGRMDVSLGTALDAVEAKQYLEMVVQVLESVRVVRSMQEANRKMREINKNPDDDILF